MKILCADYGVQTYYRLNKMGLLPSQLLYGAVELEHFGYDVEYFQFSNVQNLDGIWHDLKSLYALKYDILYLPYIRSKAIFILLFLKFLGLYKCRIIGVQHKTINGGGRCKRILKKLIYKNIDRILFHSPLNMKESILSGIITEKQSRLLYWGAQLSYYDEIMKNCHSKSDSFVSTGMENRDFKTLLSGFESLDVLLRIYATKRFACSDYLLTYKNLSKTIHVEYVEQKDDTIVSLAKIVAESYCVVVPLLSEYCVYCVGHTSIVEAMALGKPIIVTDNPYHPIDVEKEGIGLKVKPSDSQSLMEAVLYLRNHKEEARMMGCRARALAESKYNIDICAKSIFQIINSFN